MILGNYIQSYGKKHIAELIKCKKDIKAVEDYLKEYNE